ncbi:alpha/beta-hydrolase [Pholiota conissans]|uniref:Alpha/beta-hydrolase n=1 Tax=Pholiota conissans TaxID=109636 RepID=A0A9P5YRZ2_9AGAR|nr:alpha/beta-hydrolase [Pholiota conissans]
MSCPKCQEGFELPGEPLGTIEKDFNNAYYSPAPSRETPSKEAILFFTDGFGLPLKNCKIMADNFAKRLNCDVWIPDYFDGKPLVPASNLRAPDHAGAKMSIMDWVKFVLATIPHIPAFIRSRPSVADMRVLALIDLLKEKKKYEKLGATGYCYGGSTSVRFSTTDYIDTAVISHPGPFSIDLVEKIRVPTSWACAEVDIFWSHDKRMKAEAILSARKAKDGGASMEYEFIDYKGTAHGFAARPNLKRPEIKQAHEEAFEQAVKWFQKTLLVHETSQ